MLVYAGKSMQLALEPTTRKFYRLYSINLWDENKGGQLELRCIGNLVNAQFVPLPEENKEDDITLTYYYLTESVQDCLISHDYILLEEDALTASLPPYEQSGNYWTLTDEAKSRVVYAKDYLSITAEDIENVMVTALEGGIGYWAVLDNTLPEWSAMPEGMCISEYATLLLLTGGSLTFQEQDDEVKHVLTLDSLIEGIKQNTAERPHDNFRDADAITADCIIQYALFKMIIFG